MSHNYFEVLVKEHLKVKVIVEDQSMMSIRNSALIMRFELEETFDAFSLPRSSKNALLT